MLAGCGHGAHDVIEVNGGAGRGPALRDGDEALVDRAPQDQVREGQVGDDLPVGRERCEPLGLVVREGAVALGGLSQGGHIRSLRRVTR